MAAERSSSSSQIENAPSTTTIAPSSTPNTGTAGLTVPAPTAPSQPPVCVMNFCALSVALWLMAVDIQSLESISSWTMAGATAEKIAAIGRNTNAERIACIASTRTIACATLTSRIGSESTTASASITRYCDPNHLALTTLGLVVPLISPPTFCRNQLPADATAEVKLRSALSPAAVTILVAAPETAPVTVRLAPWPSWQIRFAMAVWFLAHGSAGLACCPVTVVGGAVVDVCASAAGAVTRTDASTRPASTRSQRARERLLSRGIVVLLESLGLANQDGRRGGGSVVGDGDRPILDRCTGLLPITVDPYKLDGGHAPGLLHRQAGGLVATDTGGPDGDAGARAVVELDAVAHGNGLEDHLLRVQGRARRAGQRRGDRSGSGLELPLHPCPGLRRGDGVHRQPPLGRVEQHLAGQQSGVIGGSAHGAGLRVCPADRHQPALHAAAPGPLTRCLRGARDRRGRRGGPHLGCGGTGSRGRPRCGRGLGRHASPAADQQPAGEQHHGEREHAEQPEPGSAHVSPTLTFPSARECHRRGWGRRRVRPAGRPLARWLDSCARPRSSGQARTPSSPARRPLRRSPLRRSSTKSHAYRPRLGGSWN